MDIMHIPPPKLVELVRGRPHHLVLSHFLSQYRGVFSFYQREIARGAFVTVDYPAFEGDHIDPQAHFRLARDLKASEVVLPDVRFDPTETVLNAKRWIGVAKDTAPSVVAVAQGRNRDEWLQCVRALLEVPIDVIAVVEEVEEFYPRIGRMGAVADLIEMYSSEIAFPKIHFIGGSETPQEIYWIQTRWPGVVRSLDTAKAIVWGLHLRALPKEPFRHAPHYPGRGSGWTEYTEFDETQRVLIEHNIRVMDMWAQGDY